VAAAAPRRGELSCGSSSPSVVQRRIPAMWSGVVGSRLGASEPGIARPGLELAER